MPCSETGQTNFDTDNMFGNHGSIAVIVECRDYSNFPKSSNNYEMCQQLSRNIIDTVLDLPNLAAVILSTYDSYEPFDPDLRSQNLYYKNTHDLFYQCQPIPYVKKLYERDFLSSNRKKLPPDEPDITTDPEILNQEWPCMQLAMNDVWQLEYYIKQVVPHVKNIFYFGRSWEVCVKGRPIGVDRLSELKTWGHLTDINIFLSRHGILDKCTDSGNFRWPDFSQYKQVINDIYQYC